MNLRPSSLSASRFQCSEPKASGEVIELARSEPNASGAITRPGAHDHHIHLFAAAAALSSAHCDPARARDHAGLARILRAHPPDAAGWVRGVGYFESVAGELDRAALDAILPDRPLRVQHRTGQLWMLNSAALERLGIEDATGRLHRADRRLRELRAPEAAPSLAALCERLAQRGVTHVTDATPANGPEEVALFAAAQARGELRQHVTVMGSLALSDVAPPPGIAIGPLKIHLAEAELPALDAAVAAIRAAHERGRGAAIHAATRVELLFALAAFDEAGVRAGDRIEHAHVTPPECVAALARLGLTVCASPALIASRIEEWRRDADPADREWLGRLDLLEAAGVPLLYGSDAPFGALAFSARGPTPYRVPSAAPSPAEPR
jgi:predicted amidohydrolase YtcJ